jgi:hypothetical protein
MISGGTSTSRSPPDPSRYVSVDQASAQLTTAPGGRGITISISSEYVPTGPLKTI